MAKNSKSMLQMNRESLQTKKANNNKLIKSELMGELKFKLQMLIISIYTVLMESLWIDLHNFLMILKLF